MKNVLSESTIPALELSIMPSIFAAGCCATAPLMVMFGFSFAENIFAPYVWHIRLLGVLILIVSVYIYFRKHGIADRESYLKNRTLVIITVVQTIIITALLYCFFVFYVTPYIAESLDYQLNECCRL